MLESDPGDPRMRALLDQASFSAASAAAGGGTVERFDDIQLCCDDPKSGISVLICAQDAGVQLPELRAALRRARELGTARSAVPLGCWSAADAPDRAAIATLLGGGFRWGFQPRWMRLDLASAVPGSGATVAAVPLAIEPIEDAADVQLKGKVPYLNAGHLARVGPLARSGRTRYFAARDRHGFVHAAVAIHLAESSGSGTSAGLFSLGVRPKLRGKGIGSAVTATALRWAAEHGAHQVTLNATEAGVGLYRRLGFVDLGPGQTWWIDDVRDQPVLRPDEAQAVDGIVYDDPDRLAAVPLSFWQQPELSLQCGRSPARLAAQLHSPHALTWLREHGVPVDALSAWELGMRDEARAILRERPAEVDRIDPQHRGTLLHVAAMRDDASLARTALDAGADRSVLDPALGLSALAWAEHFGSQQVASLLADG